MAVEHERLFDYTFIIIYILLIIISLPFLRSTMAEGKDAPAALASQDTQMLIAQLNAGNVAIKLEAISRLKERKEASAIVPLVRLLGDSNDAVRWESMLALTAIGSPAVDALIEALGSENQEVRWKAGNALERIGKPAVPKLINAIKSDNLSRRRETAYVLGKIKDKRAVAALAAALHDEDEHVRWKAATALKDIGPPAVEAVIAELKGPSVLARQCAAWIFQKLKDRRAARPLVAALADADKNVRSKAAIALKEMGPLAKDALADALKNGTPKIKETAYLCLHDSSDIEIQKALYHFKNEKRNQERYKACRPLKNISSHPNEWKYTFVPGKSIKQYDLTLLIKMPDNDWNSDEARVVFDYQDEMNFYCLRITNRGIRLEKILDGKATILSGPIKEKMTEGADILIKCRVGKIALFWNGKNIASIWDSTFSEGRIGLAATSDEIRFGKVKRQKIDDIYFADDFMQSDLASGVWEQIGGSWSLDSVNTPSRSANAFRLIGKTDSIAFWLTGYEFWDNYSFKVAVQPKDDAAVGLCFYYSDIGNYYLLRWTGNSSHSTEHENITEVGTAPDEPTGKVELIRVHNGEETIIAQRVGGHPLDQWYELAVTVLDGQITAYIDDDVIYDGYDEYLSRGKVGLYTESRVGTLFDDVVVQSVDGLNDNFSAGTGKWNEIRGSWRLGKMYIPRSSEPSSNGTFKRLWKKGNRRNMPTRDFSRTYIVRNKDEAISVTGNPRWSNYEFSADVRSTRGEVGIIFAYQNGKNYGLFRWLKDPHRGSKRELLKLVNGEAELLVVDYEDRKLRRWYNLSVKLEGDFVKIAVDGREIFSVFDSDLSEGAVGLYAKNAIRAGFDNVRVRLNLPPKALQMASKIFSKQRKMENWATNYSNWEHKRLIVLNTEALVSWHKGYFFNDVTIEAQMHWFYSLNGRAGIMLCENVNDVDSGYHFQVESKGKNEATARLFFKGEKISESEIEVEPTQSRIWKMKFERHGEFIVCYVNDEVVILHRGDPSKEGLQTIPRPGKIGLYANGTTTFSNTQKVKIYSDDVYDYMFEKAPVDWHVQAGYWRVTNRWICDPTWSWMGGTDKQFAALWNKRYFEGDMIMEFFAAIKMDLPYPPHYHRRSDINAVICGDGENLDSGYAFFFGGWDNEWTRILRKGKIVAETKSITIPKFRGTHHDIHWRWFHIRIEKIGATIRYYIDGNLAIEYTDPHPLAGGQAAIWTYNNGVILARFRIYHKEDAPRKSPFTFGESIGFNESPPVPPRNARAKRMSPAPKIAPEVARTAFPLYNDFEHDLGSWENYDGAQGAIVERDSKTASTGEYSLKLTNLNGGGSFAARCTSANYDAAEYPIVRFDYKIPHDVKVDLYFGIDNRKYAVLLTGTGEFNWPVKMIGKVDSIVTDNKWHHAEFNLLTMLSSSLNKTRFRIEEVVIGNYSNKDYLLCGFGGNRRGAEYHIDNFSISAK